MKLYHLLTLVLIDSYLCKVKKKKKEKKIQEKLCEMIKLIGNNKCHHRANLM